MIFDTLKNKANYKQSPLLYQALCYLDALKQGSLPLPGTVLVQEKLFANPITLISKPEEDLLFEAHRNYIDIHYMVKGIEGIATADLSALNVVIPYDEEKDIEFLTGEEDGRYYLKPGQFMICYPTDAHKVAIMKDLPDKIQKIVLKIATDK